MPIDFTPRHCQALMGDFMLNHNRCNVWSSPGTGKTSAVYWVIDILKLLGSQFFPALVLAPKRVAVDVWPREQKKWNQFADLRVVSLAGREGEFDRIEQLRRKADIYVINYDLVQWLVDYFQTKKLDWPFRTVIADEATKLKSFRLRNGGKRAMALARMQKHVGRWINLTGTPSPNGLIDLWGQCWFLDRGERLGRTFGEFKERYFYENLYTGEVLPREGADVEIAKKLSDITLSIRAEDYFDLPPLTHNRIVVDMKPDAMAMYRKFEHEMFLEIEGKGVEAMNAATVTGKCLQMASGAVYTEGEQYAEFDSVKLDALGDLLEDMNGEPLLVAYHWRFDVPRITGRFPSARVIKTTEDIDDWNAGKIRLGLIHPASAGHGIDLAKGGNHLCFYSHSWSLEEYLQVIERLGPTRQAQHGLNRPVFLHFLIARDTLDEAVMERREGKRRVQDILIERMRK